MDADAAARPCAARDLVALIGLLAVIEGGLTTGEVTPRLAGRLRERLERAGLLPPGGAGRELRQALDELNQRLRYALGEYDEPPAPDRA